MTKEEAKQLKNGDKILIEVIFDQIDDDGDAVIEYTNSVSDYECGFIATKHIVCGVSETQPNKPKYDPCRLFKKGDKVRVVERSGRNPVLPFMDCKVGDIGTVIKDEEVTSFFVRLHLEGKYEKDMPYCHLELVTPVEELEPFFVYEDATSWQVKKGNSLCARYGKATHPHAKEAAEAECARLNAEYRKEQNND